jgi:diadenosine tetraphosphate (Ap4A) HIT family hydrolase
MTVNIENSDRNDGGAYRGIIEQIAKDAVCPFCAEHLPKYHPNPILIESEFWLLTKNAHPYSGTLHHILMICRRHVTRLTDLTPEEVQDLHHTLTRYTTENNIAGGSFFMREGDTTLTGASVQHLHAQYLSKDPEWKEPVLARLG